MGDLNTHDTEVGYNLLVKHAKLQDAFKCTQESTKCGKMVTCYARENCFTHRSVHKHYGEGIRIDYVLFRRNTDDLSVDCLSCSRRLGKVPNCNNLNYSDHEGVYAEFSIQRGGMTLRSGVNVNTATPIYEPDRRECLQYYQRAQEIIQRKIEASINHATIFVGLVSAMIALLVFLNYCYPRVGSFANILCTFVLLVYFVYALIVKPTERKHLDNCYTSLKVHINQINQEQSNYSNKSRSNSSPKSYQKQNII